MSGAALEAIDRIAIIGLGLIGGSIARGLRAAGFQGGITGAVSNAPDVERACELGLVDDCHAEIEAAIRNADLIVIATPPGSIGRVLAEVAAHRSAHAIVTDTGSSKMSVVEAAIRAFDSAAMALFVPGHPIAGTENSGLEAGFSSLFSSRRVILTPDDSTDPVAVTQVAALWAALGAEPAYMTPAHHDEVLAATSHLPHVLAYTLVDTLAAMDRRTEIFAYAAGGFADFTRIASSDAVLWRDIVAANREPVLYTLDVFMDRLQQVRQAIADGDDDSLHEVFARAKTARDGFAASRQEQQP